MIKKLSFLPLCLALSFSSPTQAQTPSLKHNTIKHLSTHEMRLLEEAIKQLPEEELVAIEQVLSKKNNSHVIGEIVIGSTAIGIPVVCLFTGLLYCITKTCFKNFGNHNVYDINNAWSKNQEIREPND